VSACLLGVNCRYDGANRRDQNAIEFVKEKLVVPVCPELLSGLGFPRLPAEIERGDGFTVLSGKARALQKDGADVTRAFLAGAKEALKLALLSRANTALLKDQSPSCGVNFIYHKGRKIRGAGIFTALLIREGFKVISEKELDGQAGDKF